MSKKYSEKETFEITTANLLYKNEMYKGIFISDKIFIVKDNGENEDIKYWLKTIIKEAVWEALNGIQIIER